MGRTQRSTDQTLAGIAAKALKEARYHFRHSSTWVIRLGDGTEESHRREQMKPSPPSGDSPESYSWATTPTAMAVAGIGVDPATLRPGWEGRIGAVLAEALLEPPTGASQRIGGRQGYHTEHLGKLVAEMQWLAAACRRRVVSTTIGTDDLTEIRSVIASVTDPEIPVLTIDDLGILRDVSIEEGRVVATITPTYSGCPAMDAIREAIVASLPER